MSGIGSGSPTDSRPPVPEWDDLILVGVVARTHGNRGEVIVNSETDFPESRFRPGVELQTRLKNGVPTTLVVNRARMHQGRPVIEIEGYRSIGEAEALAGCELRVPVSVQQPLPRGTYYHHQLIGSDVVTEEGTSLGRVTAVEGGTGTSRLVVRGVRRELQIPLASDICAVDVDARRIVVRPPEGLLDL